MQREKSSPQAAADDTQRAAEALGHMVIIRPKAGELWESSQLLSVAVCARSRVAVETQRKKKTFLQLLVFPRTTQREERTAGRMAGRSYGFCGEPSARPGLLL
uniref:Uncharacterized protein n=1 Tax=Knipowitschia caucasica TaxID=637954 RepID=A0AAV2LRU6_KNICA